MFCIALTMKLKPGCYERYKQAHDELWPGVAQSMINHNVSMAIYRLGDRLFLHAVAPTESDWLKSREYPVLDRWNREMTRLLETDAQGDIALEQLPNVFAFGVFRGEGADS